MPFDFGAGDATSAFGTIAQVWGQQETNKTNEGLASANRDWMTQMSNTAHQREVQDLTAAGLNPILSVNRSGASTPQGTPARVDNPMGGMSQAGAQLALIQAQSAKLAAETRNLDAETRLRLEGKLPESIASASQSSATADSIRQEMGSFEKRMMKLGWDVKSAEFDAGIKNSEDFIRAKMKDLDVARYQVEEIMNRSKKLANEARLLGLDIPRGLREAAYWASDKGEVAAEMKHAPSAQHLGTGLIIHGADALKEYNRGLKYEPRKGAW